MKCARLSKITRRILPWYSCRKRVRLHFRQFRSRAAGSRNPSCGQIRPHLTRFRSFLFFCASPYTPLPSDLKKKLHLWARLHLVCNVCARKKGRPGKSSRESLQLHSQSFHRGAEKNKKIRVRFARIFFSQYAELLSRKKYRYRERSFPKTFMCTAHEKNRVSPNLSYSFASASLS